MFFFRENCKWNIFTAMCIISLTFSRIFWFSNLSSVVSTFSFHVNKIYKFSPNCERMTKVLNFYIKMGIARCVIALINCICKISIGTPSAKIYLHENGFPICRMKRAQSSQWMNCNLNDILVDTFIIYCCWCVSLHDMILKISYIVKMCLRHFYICVCWTLFTPLPFEFKWISSILYLYFSRLSLAEFHLFCSLSHFIHTSLAI